MTWKGSLFTNLRAIEIVLSTGKLFTFRKTGIKDFEGKQQGIYTNKSIDEHGNGLTVMIMIHFQLWGKNEFFISFQTRFSVFSCTGLNCFSRKIRQYFNFEDCIFEILKPISGLSRKTKDEINPINQACVSASTDRSGYL